VPRTLANWLACGDAADADWARLVVLRANGGALGLSGRLLLDLPALAQPFRCRSGECTPGRREPRTRSCCADIEVTLTPWERRAVLRALPALAAFLAPRDPRWSRGAPAIFEGDALCRPDGTCILAIRRRCGLRCALQELERARRLRPGALKPLSCRLFPLVVVDLGRGRRLLTAVHAGTALLGATPPPRLFPCLRGDPGRPPLYRELHPVLEALLGGAAYRALGDEVRRYRRTHVPEPLR
jgi:hypothetical protein